MSGVPLAPVPSTGFAPVLSWLQRFSLVIHVWIAFAGSAPFVCSFSTTVLSLVLQLVPQRRQDERAAGRPTRAGRLMKALLPSVELERLTYRLIAISVPRWACTWSRVPHRPRLRMRLWMGPARSQVR